MAVHYLFECPGWKSETEQLLEDGYKDGRSGEEELKCAVSLDFGILIMWELIEEHVHPGFDRQGLKSKNIGE